MNIIETLNEAIEIKYHLKESKEDKERFKSFVNDDDLCDRFETLKSKHIIKGQDADYTYWEKRSVDELKDFIDRIWGELSKNKQDEQTKKEGAIQIDCPNDDWAIYQILTHEAAQIYGKNTRWCITSKTAKTTFDNFLNGCAEWYFLWEKGKEKRGKICYVVNKQDRDKLGLFYDSADRCISDYQIAVILRNIPYDVLSCLPGISNNITKEEADSFYYN